jgi:hypothetical protein
MGIDVKDILGQDPEFLRRQMLMKDMQAAQQTDPFSAIGFALGRGAGNVASGRGFFDTPDPALQKATKIKQLQAQIAQSGEKDPVKLTNMFADALAQDPDLAPFALKIREQATELQSKQREQSLRERAIQVQERQITDQEFKNNPELLLSAGLALPENDPKRVEFLTRYSRIAEERNFSIAKQEADLKRANAELAKTEAETARIRAVTAQERQDAEGNRVNNNGNPVGTFDKVGRYRAPDGRVVTAKAFETALSEHDAAADLVFRLERLTDDDIKNAYGSALDYTTTLGGGIISSNKTYNAQTKINEVGIRNVLNNLQNLKGPSSDKEMAQMIKDFPGYQASPDVMRAWVNRAVDATNRFLERSEKRYGFDTDYGTKNRFKVGSRTEKQPKTQAPSAGSTWRILD